MIYRLFNPSRVAVSFVSFSPGFTGGYSNLTLFRVFELKSPKDLNVNNPR